MKPWVLGLDLGQAADYTCLVGFELTTVNDQRHYGCRILERYQLGTSYVTVANSVRDRVNKPPLAGCVLAVDQTGVGRAVVDILREKDLPCTLAPITITGGTATSGDIYNGYHVPKKELVGILQALMQTSRIRIANQLPHADTFKKELTNFKAKITAAGNETMSAWRDSDHDDIVLAAACACWAGEKLCVWGEIGLPPEGKRHIGEMAPKGVFNE